MSGPNPNLTVGLPLSRRLSFANDGYNYEDAGSAPEDTPTAAAPLKHRLARSQTNISDDIEITLPRTDSQRYEHISLRVFSRPIEGSWRTGVPAFEERPHQQPSPQQQRRRQQQQQQQQQQQNGPAATAEAANIDDLEILHNWTREDEHDEVHLKLNVHKGGPASSIPATRTEVIRWIHSNSHVLSRTGFENTVVEHVGRYLDTGIKALTQRLLKRVWLSDERDFIGGKFLQPTAIRYDGQPKATSEEARSCTFFNFPYLSLDTHRLKTCTQGCIEYYRTDRNGHPKRTLLQSRYRLESTAAKDESQSITALSRQDIAKCVKPSNRQLALSSPTNALPIVHVPQLWIASLSGDVLLTGGTLPLQELQGKIVRTGPAGTRQRPEGSGPALVRILLRDSGKVQRFIYPSDQCDWWFSLLSKQREISRHLSKSNEDSQSTNASSASSSSPVPGTSSSVAKYKFYASDDPNDGHSIGILNWLQYLGQSPSKERLDVWLHKDPKIPDIVVTSAGEPPSKLIQRPSAPAADSVASSSSATAVHSNAAKSTATATAGKSTAADTSRTVSQSSSQSQPLSPVLLPFLQWPIIDDLGDEDDRDQIKRANLKLNEICENVVSRHSSSLQYHSGRKLFLASVPQNPPSSQPTRTVDEVLKKIQAQRDNLSNDQLTIIKGFVEHCQNLLECFTPSYVSSPLALPLTFGDFTFHVSPSKPPTDLTSHHAVALYWSVVGGIVDHSVHNTDLLDEIPLLTKDVREIEKRAAELHVGTCTLRDLQTQHPVGATPPVTARSKVLLEVILDALRTIFDILIKFVAQLEPQEGQQYQIPQQLKASHEELVKKACDLLETAKDRLIAEADDIVHDKGLGPVVTPEAIVIMLLDRLSRGVYEDGTADIMDLYERIVETIALRVETKHSRRLLLKINRLQEELDIIYKVLQQQKTAILMYRKSLDPQTYQPRSIPRQMNFDHESKYIDKIIRGVQDRIVDCRELIERTKSLAAQNVQLVETRQEENNNAIMVFTIVTVIFLPPSFLTGYFGMNLQGLIDNHSRPVHFWEIAAPLTVIFVAICLIIIFYRPMRRRWELRKKKMA